MKVSRNSAFGTAALTFASIISTSASAAQPAASQSAAATASDVGASAVPSEGLDEIVVTARKRSESLIDVPVAISVISPREIERANIQDITQITRLVPQLILARAASGNGGTLGIRGISASYSDFGVDSPVSLDIDGAQFSRGYIANSAALDLANVQVLKGPQALFFGKNSPGGVISLTSNNPGNRFEAAARVGYEFRADQKYIEGYVSGPLSDSFGVRLAARYDTMAGYFRNNARAIANPFPDAALAPTYPGAIAQHSPDSTNATSRLTLEFSPPETGFTANLKLLYSRYQDKEATGSGQVVFCTGGGPDDGGQLDPFGDCRADRNRSAGDLPAQFAIPQRDRGMDVEAKLTTLTLEKDFGPTVLTSQSVYYDQDIALQGCLTYTVYCRLGGVTYERMWDAQQEVRLLTKFESPLNFMLGGYYEKSSRDLQANNPNSTAGGRVTLDPATGSVYAVQFLGVTKNDVWSAFGQAILNVGESVELTAGVRYTHETKDGNFQNFYVSPVYVPATPPGAFAPTTAVLRPEFTGNNFSPEITVRWRLAPRQSLFAAFRTGYKSGGFSNPVFLFVSSINAGERALEFGAEKAKGGEIGYKGELADGRLSLTADVYYYKFTGLQRSALDIVTNNFVVRNAASATTKGFEVDVRYAITDGLNVRTNLTYNRARYGKYSDAPCYNPTAPGCRLEGAVRLFDLSGTPLSRAPEWVIAGGPDYTIPVSSTMNLELAADARYSDKYITQEDGNPAGVQKAYTKVNASITLRQDDDHWSLALVGRNLTDKYVALYTAAKPGSLAVAGVGPDLFGLVDRGRELVVQAGYKF